MLHSQPYINADFHSVLKLIIHPYFFPICNQCGSIFLPVFLSTRRCNVSSFMKIKMTAFLVSVESGNIAIVCFAVFLSRPWYWDDVPPCQSALIPLPIGQLPCVYLRECWLFVWVFRGRVGGEIDAACSRGSWFDTSSGHSMEERRRRNGWRLKEWLRHCCKTFLVQPKESFGMQCCDCLQLACKTCLVRQGAKFLIHGNLKFLNTLKMEA